MKFDRNEKTWQNKFVRDVLTNKAWISFLFKERDPLVQRLIKTIIWSLRYMINEN